MFLIHEQVDNSNSKPSPFQFELPRYMLFIIANIDGEGAKRYSLNVLGTQTLPNQFCATPSIVQAWNRLRAGPAQPLNEL